MNKEEFSKIFRSWMSKNNLKQNENQIAYYFSLLEERISKDAFTQDCFKQTLNKLALGFYFRDSVPNLNNFIINWVVPVPAPTKANKPNPIDTIKEALLHKYTTEKTLLETICKYTYITRNKEHIFSTILSEGNNIKVRDILLNLSNTEIITDNIVDEIYSFMEFHSNEIVGRLKNINLNSHDELRAILYKIIYNKYIR